MLRLPRPGGGTAEELLDAARLGAPYKVYTCDVSPFRVEVARRIAALNVAAGLPGDAPVTPDTRSQVRTDVAREFFVREHGRAPVDARELAGTIARGSRSATTAVAGYDLTFSPVKSVSTLWAVADRDVALRIEGAHHAAVRDALAFLETHALFTRTGTNGVRQVDVTGLVAAAFTHRDSRAGDPDLHTHVAVANKVQTTDGRWLSIDGRVLYKATVTASETYNTAVEQHLRAVGVRFAERPNPDPRKRPVREIVGIDPALNQRWSTRRASIQVRHGNLAAQFHVAHGRPPTPVESIQLAQQATLETRDAKHEPRSLAEQRDTWRAQAITALGSPARLSAMIRTSLHPPRATPSRSRGVTADGEWVHAAAGRVLAAMESRRATWQVWHVRAEAHRQLRGLDTPGALPGGLAGPGTAGVERAVDLVVAEVLQARSVSLARPTHGITEPPVLRRGDGASVYTVAGADLFTSERIITAEERLVATAGRRDGHAVSSTAVDLALLASTANGVTLNAGQVDLVRQMATSGKRLQLAIAPAGAGKTTAMRALAAAWAEGHGTVIGLAPSAAAAATLRDHLGPSIAVYDTGTTRRVSGGGSGDGDVHTDTLAKLTWSLDHDDLPRWATAIGPTTLVIIDEAGMADTLSLDTAVAYIIDKGGSVRLIGDDQQLAAVGAGGVLRDIDATHGAIQLWELLRFTDPAEGAASLALRDGRPEALGFYLDTGRVHVGDLTTITDDVFTAWHTDRDHGLDSIMLAPTRDLVADLNHRARTDRLTTDATPTTPRGRVTGRVTGRVVRLADGNDASAGDLVITRDNDRRLRVSTTDWVKNGDRWTVLTVHGGSMTVQHTRHGHTVKLPARYVTASTELGYATTVHTAQGVSVDTMHGLAAGAESRQQLYTMLTRGRHANHVYLDIVGDGDPHGVLHPDVVRPLTATDVLERVLAHDDAPRSATTLLRDATNPAVLLGEATTRYVDALHVAADHLAGPHTVAALDTAADDISPRLRHEPAWPVLRAALLLLGADGADPAERLRAAAISSELDTAHDTAAVLAWRLDPAGLHSTSAGPLPWVPGIPTALASHETWGPYLTRRAQLVHDLAADVRTAAVSPVGTSPTGTPPPWSVATAAPAEVVGDVAVWRAAMQIPDEDRRPTGPPHLQKAAAAWQRTLDDRLTTGRTPALDDWGPLFAAITPTTRADAFAPVLADHLARLARAGHNAHALLTTAVGEGPLPDDHTAAALWWRIRRHLTTDHDPTPDNTTPDDMAPGDGPLDGQPPADPWDALTGDHPHPAPSDRDATVHPTADGVPDIGTAEPSVSTQVSDRVSAWVADEVEGGLLLAAQAREVRVALPPSTAAVERLLHRTADAEFSAVTPERTLQINEWTLQSFEAHLPGSWSQRHLTDRFGTDLTGHQGFRPGHAPAGWTTLVTHLRDRGVTDAEMLAAGVATRASTGRLIDRFRDRVVLPVTRDGDVLGFIGRRHPDHTDSDQAGPKYLNTADTIVFHKGAQLFGITDPHLATGATPVLVEGPIDAIAVTLASNGTHIGVAPLGTSLTEEQTTQLAALGRDPVIATDADTAGHVAAERAYWLLTTHGLDPTRADLPTGTDPAALLTTHGPGALHAALTSAPPLADVLIAEKVAHLPADRARTAAAAVLAARPSDQWAQGAQRLSTTLDTPLADVRADLLTAVRAWNRDPQRAAENAIHDEAAAARDRRAALDTAAEGLVRVAPAKRWAALATSLDRRLLIAPDWPALADVLQHAHDHGHDVPTTTRQLLTDSPLGLRPAFDLRYRVTAHLNLTLPNTEHRPATGPDPRPDAQPAIGNSTARPGGSATRPEHEQPGPARLPATPIGPTR